MDETPQWVSLNLDPGTAQFLGLPSRLYLPLSTLPSLQQGVSVGALAEALHCAVDMNPNLGQENKIQRFLSRSSQLGSLENYLRVGNLTFAGQVAKGLHQKDASDPLALSTLGRLALLEKHFDRALQFLNRCLKAAPMHAPTKLEYAVALAGTGNEAGALELLASLEKHAAVGLLARIWRWELEHAHVEDLGERSEFLRRVLQQRENASESAADLERRFPGNPEARFLTLVHPSWSLPDAARIAALQIILRDAPDHITARVLLAQLLRRAGQVDRALTILEDAPHPGHTQIRAAQGLCLEHLGRRDEARETYRSVFETRLEEIPHAALIQAGHGLLRVGSPVETRVLLEDAAKARPKDSLPRQILARLDELDGKQEACEQRLREAQKTCGQTPGLAYALGDFLRRTHRESEALGVFKALISREPGSPWGYRGLGDLVLGEQPQKAIEHYARALAIDPDTPIPGHDYLRGVAALRGGDFEQAETWLARAVAGEPDNARYWCDLGATQFYRLRLEQAMESTERALQLDPKNPGYAHNLSQYHQTRFRTHPLQHWKSFVTARRLERKARSWARSTPGWRKDLWHGPDKED